MQDSILFWNAVALEANRISHSDPDKRQQNGPTLSSRAIAIVHLAMYDAFAAVDGTLTRYLPAPPPPLPGASARDAVAGAAHSTLSALYSAQADFFDAQLSCFNTDDPGFLFGREVGRALLRLRENDMDARDCGYIPSPQRGRHRRDPDNPGQGFYSPFYGAQNKTFAVSQRHALAPPPFDDGTNTKYRRALVDVRTRGIRPDLTATLPTAALFNRRRFPEDTLIGIYWAYDGANRLGTPPRLYNQIIRLVAMNKINPDGRINNESDNARLFAFVNAALGDAGILAWEQKYCHDFWRPVVGIREHHNTLGPIAPYEADTEFIDGDPGWLPLGAPSTNSPGMKNFTPDFPAYPSGHATFGAAALHITRMFYGVAANNKSGDSLFEDLFFVSDELNGGNRDNNGTVRPRHTRFFPDGLWQMIIENALSRVMLGVHWVFDAFDFTGGGGNSIPNPSLTNENIGGVGLGLRIARDIFAHGNSGGGPQMTPDTELPPIITPPPDSPMPTRPTQPAEVGDCIGPAVARLTRRVTKPTKKGAQKGARKKAAAKEDVITEDAGKEERAWPTGISEEDQSSPTVSGAWPSGISEK